VQALELQSFLFQTKRANNGFGQRFHKNISKIIDVPWEMATIEVLRHPEIKGERTFAQPYKQWYCKRVYELSASEPEIYIRLVGVMNLIRSPLHLFHPKVLFAIYGVTGAAVAVVGLLLFGGPLFYSFGVHMPQQGYAIYMELGLALYGACISLLVFVLSPTIRNALFCPGSRIVMLASCFVMLAYGVLVSVILMGTAIFGI
jgi:hypothetical protein